MTGKSVAAVVPMRHDSERVKGKNFRDFGGKPLFWHVIKCLQACKSISQIIIDTDSEVVQQEARKYFPDVTLLLRPEHLRDGGVPMNDVLLNTIGQVEADFYLQTHSTNPLLRPNTVSAAISQFLSLYPMYDSLFGVTRLQTRIWDELARAVNHNPAILLRTQDLPPVYEENSCLYIFTKEIIEQRHNRIGSRPLLFEIEKREATDIDDEADFEIAEMLYLRTQKNTFS